MPNPFPGMNPYLENPRRWRDVHGALIYAFRAELSHALRPPYGTFVEERVYIQATAKEYVADELVVKTLPSAPGKNEGGVATLGRPPAALKAVSFNEPRRLVFEGVAHRERFIEVRTGDDLEEVVAVIEFLSPTNKTRGAGQNEYQRKQRDLLDGTTHLLEIDLLRDGHYTLAPPEEETRQRLGKFDYLISLHTALTGNVFDVWPVTLRDRLPCLRLPLTGEESVSVDMQAVLERAYRDNNYDQILNYGQPPVPTLSPDDAAWANDLIAKMNAAQTGTTNAVETKDL